jgi:hypothetical protein
MPVSTDFEIVEDNKSIGWIRVKPNAILWSKGTHSWHSVTVEQFAKFAKNKGKKVAK